MSIDFIHSSDIMYMFLNTLAQWFAVNRAVSGYRNVLKMANPITRVPYTLRLMAAGYNPK